MHPIAQLEKAQIHPSRTDLDDLRANLASVANANPSLPQVWSTSAKLISFNSQNFTYMQNLGNCNERPWTELLQDLTPHDHPETVKTVQVVAFHDCTLVLDDQSGFLRSSAGLTVLSLNNKHPDSVFELSLSRVHLVYRGGLPISFFSYIVLNDCTYDFVVPEKIPPPSGVNLLQGLLTADLMLPSRISLLLSPSTS